mmetsp:Transcript_24840/g.72765  ORF Transcript_24840/g.72765 Transcript_24840/m.72765 type:complete len:304 (-) Transcript_24840:271-1182(-)
MRTVFRDGVEGVRRVQFDLQLRRGLHRLLQRGDLDPALLQHLRQIRDLHRTVLVRCVGVAVDRIDILRDRSQFDDEGIFFPRLHEVIERAVGASRPVPVLPTSADVSVREVQPEILRVAGCLALPLTRIGTDLHPVVDERQPLGVLAHWLRLVVQFPRLQILLNGGSRVIQHGIDAEGDLGRKSGFGLVRVRKLRDAFASPGPAGLSAEEYDRVSRRRLEFIVLGGESSLHSNSQLGHSRPVDRRRRLGLVCLFLVILLPRPFFFVRAHLLHPPLHDPYEQSLVRSSLGIREGEVFDGPHERR